MNRGVAAVLIALNLVGCAAGQPRATRTIEQKTAAAAWVKETVNPPERLSEIQTVTPTPGPTPFRFELEETPNPYRGTAVEGTLHNGLSWRIGNVRLRVESLDPAGKVTGEAYGWVLGDAPAGGRAYFFVPVSVRGAAYRATVESFDKIWSDGP